MAAQSSGELEKRLKEAFDTVDKDGDGYLDLGEVSDVFRMVDPDNPHRNKNLWHMMDKLDTKPPYGRIEWIEFRDYWLQNGGVDMTYGKQFTSEAWQETLANPDLITDEQHPEVTPDVNIRHHHYEGSTILDAEEIPNGYAVKQKLGAGHYASVHLVEKLSTGAESAMKIFYKLRMSQKDVHSVIREANLMRLVTGHPNIVQIHDLIETRQRLLLMLEPVMGGHLYSVILANQKRKSITEGDVARIMCQILSALAHMHKNDVIHCDLKPENIMCTSNNSDFGIKITDFGLSKHLVDDNKTLKSFVGTPLYAAPEVHGPSDAVRKRMRAEGKTKQSYGALVDVWSAGTMMFELLTGKPQFHRSKTLVDLKRRVHMFEGILTAGPKDGVVRDGVLIERKETLVAREMQAEMNQNKVSPLAQDLIAQLLNPRAMPCTGTFSEVRYVQKAPKDPSAPVVPVSTVPLHCESEYRLVQVETKGCVDQALEENPDLRAELDSGDAPRVVAAEKKLDKLAREKCFIGRCQRHCRISAERALDHPWILEEAGPDARSRSLADQLATLSITNSRRKLHRAVSKILFMRRIVMAMRMSVSGNLLTRVQSGAMGEKNKAKDKGCACQCSLQ